MIEVNQKLIVRCATILNEPDCKLIQRMLETLGEQRFVAAVQQALDLEDNGGMLTKRDDRRRTPGGTLVQLVKQTATAEDQALLFSRAVRHVRPTQQLLASGLPQ